MSLRIRRRRDGVVITRLEGELLDRGAGGRDQHALRLQVPLLAVKRADRSLAMAVLPDSGRSGTARHVPCCHRVWNCSILGTIEGHDEGQ